MPKDAESMKAEYIDAVEQRKEALVELCSKVVQVPTPNPPGDTRELADFVEGVLKDHGLGVQRYTREPIEPNLVSVQRAGDSPHLMFCGHFDVFQAPYPELWTDPPYSGKVKDGKIYGRGTSDMKGGFTGLLFAFTLLKDLGISLPGKLSFVAVSDEEDGGTNGLGWLLEAYPELVGNGCIIGEPNSVDQVSIANKGIVNIRLVSEGESMHGGLSAADGAIDRLAQAIVAIGELVKEEVPPPEEMERVIRLQIEKNRTGADERHGKGWLATRFGVNVGMVQGGFRFNVSPRIATAEVDLRLPLVVTPDEAVAKVRGLLDRAGCEEVQIVPSEEVYYPPHFTPPTDRLAQLVHANVARVRGEAPIFIMTFPSGDIRFIRLRGVPGVVYGTDPHNVGGIDEYITVDDLVTVTKVYGAAAIDYFYPD